MTLIEKSLTFSLVPIACFALGFLFMALMGEGFEGAAAGWLILGGTIILSGLSILVSIGLIIYISFTGVSNSASNQSTLFIITILINVFYFLFSFWWVSGGPAKLKQSKLFKNN